MEKTEKMEIKIKGFNPFLSRITADSKKDFDKYYYDVTETEVFKATGQKDENGNDLGVSEKKLIIKKVDIHDLLESQRDSVGVESYMRALAVQGDSIDNYNTQIGEKIIDYSNMPDTLAEVMTAGDRAKKAFADMDPALRGNHTTIDGFLNSLTQESIDNYIKGRVEALTPVVKVKEGE